MTTLFRATELYDLETHRSALAASRALGTYARKKRASEAARSRSSLRWKDRDLDHANALDMAGTLNVRSRAAAARHIADQFERVGGGDPYTVETVDTWLKAAGWMPRQRASATHAPP